MEEAPIFVVRKGSTGKTSFRLDCSRLIVGRDAGADITIDNEHISRAHLEITRSGDSAAIRDLGSTNGSAINGQDLGSEKVTLRIGDVITLADGEVVLHFLAGDSTVPTHRSAVFASCALFEVDDSTRDVIVRGEKVDPPLSAKEFDVLAEMYRRAGEAISRDEVAQAGWPERHLGDVGDDEVTQIVRRIRRRIEKDGHNPEFIVTVRGFGYKLEVGRSDSG